MARKTAAKSKASKKPTASASKAPSRRIVETATFRNGKSGKIVHMDVKTKPLGKIVSAMVGGRTKSIAISQ